MVYLELRDAVFVLGALILCAEAVAGIVLLTRIEIDLLAENIQRLSETGAFLTALSIIFLLFAKAYAIYDFVKEEIRGEEK